MWRFESDPIDVRGDGRVMLYMRKGLKKPKFQTRIRVPGSTGYKRVSTGTGDQRAAERFALNLYDELALHVKAGGEPPHLNWSTVMFRKRRTENGEQTTQARGDSSEVAAG